MKNTETPPKNTKHKRSSIRNLFTDEEQVPVIG